MKDQINTIREALKYSERHGSWLAADALTALDQLEAMVGEPVADINVRPSESGGTIASVFSHKLPVGSWLLYRAAPVAQHSPEEPIELLWQVRSALALACAICDAVPNREPGHLGKLVNAQDDGTHGYRQIHDAEAALVAYLTTPEAAPPTQQPQYEAGDVASASAQGFRDGVASVTQQEPVAWAMPKGDGTFIDVITPAEHAREEGSYTVPLFAHPVAQQPQARQDFTDEWTGYLKDGETPFERFLRERKDMQSVLELYQRVLEENERLKTQQPQAEAVPQGWKLALDEDMRQRADKLASALRGSRVNYAVEQAAADLILEMRDALVAAPQQAEAVPSDVVRMDWIAMHGSFGVDSVTGLPGGNGQKRIAATRAAIDTAMAQGANHG